MSKIISDYHMHTPLCGHAVGAPEEYVRQAMKLGLKEMGFSDHAPFVVQDDSGWSMRRGQLPEYHRMIEDVQNRYKNDIKILMSIEADFVPGYEAKTQALLEEYDYDYVIGSVHFIGDWGFDNPAERAKWNQSDVNAVYRDYFELLRQSAQSGLFDIMAHVDLVKKFGHRPTENLSDEIRKTAEVFYETGMVIEINTSGWRKDCAEAYPALDHLKIYSAAGVPLTFGSDAHDPSDVGRDFDRAHDLALAAGFTEYVRFEKRHIVKKVALGD